MTVLEPVCAIEQRSGTAGARSDDFDQKAIMAPSGDQVGERRLSLAGRSQDAATRTVRIGHRDAAVRGERDQAIPTEDVRTADRPDDKRGSDQRDQRPRTTMANRRNGRGCGRFHEHSGPRPGGRDGVRHRCRVDGPDRGFGVGAQPGRQAPFERRQRLSCIAEGPPRGDPGVVRAWREPRVATSRSPGRSRPRSGR